jgi:hypothetical protein
MALADIVLNDGQGTPVAHTFTYVSTVGNRVIRADFAAPVEQPIKLSIAHQDQKIAGAPAKSHLARIDLTLLDADGVTPHTANVRMMVDVPNAILSDALADDMAAYFRNWLTSANMRALLRGSVF